MINLYSALANCTATCRLYKVDVINNQLDPDDNTHNPQQGNYNYCKHPINIGRIFFNGL